MSVAARTGLAWTMLAVLLLGLAVGLVVVNGPFWRSETRSSAPPLEQLAVERQLLDSDGITLEVRAGPALPVRIAQVQVDGAFWDFAQAPLETLPPGTGGWLRIPYPWVHGEGHEIRIISSTGAVFKHRIERAAPTPVPTPRPSLGLLGLVIGAAPLALTLIGRPFGRWANPSLGAGPLGLTLAGLVMLLAGTTQTAFECATETGMRISTGVAVALVLLVAAATAALLLLATRLVQGGGAGRRLRGLAQAMGLRNACAGLAIGAAFAVQASTLASGLALGLVLHNWQTSGRWLAHLSLPHRVPRRLVGPLACVGLPTALAVGLGAYASDPGSAAIALAVGAGALLRMTMGLAWYLAHRWWPALGGQILAKEG